MNNNALTRELEDVREDNPQLAGEIAFAIAKRCQNVGDVESAQKYGAESITLFQKVAAKSVSECTAIRTEIGGIQIPALIHEDVVRSRLAPLAL